MHLGLQKTWFPPQAWCLPGEKWWLSGGKWCHCEEESPQNGAIPGKSSLYVVDISTILGRENL